MTLSLAQLTQVAEVARAEAQAPALIASSKESNPFDDIPEGHAINVCFGGGVDSTAMLVLMRRWNVVPDLITFADTGGEKPETYEHVRAMDPILRSWGFPTVTWCKLKTLPSTPYNDLWGNNDANETLPSLAMGKKGCSVKWKQGPQDNFLKGINDEFDCPEDMPANRANWHKPHPLWIESQATGRKIVKLLGYDNGTQDIKRSKKLKKEDKSFLYRYPLQAIGWTRPDCVKAIADAGVPMPIKSACFFCPASQKWELWWLAGTHPDLFMAALSMEWKAMIGPHSRWDGDLGKWDEVIKGDTFPSTKVTVGLGRSFAWNFWARQNGVVNQDGSEFIADRAHCLRMAEKLQADGGNAADARLCNG